MAYKLLLALNDNILNNMNESGQIVIIKCKSPHWNLQL